MPRPGRSALRVRTLAGRTRVRPVAILAALLGALASCATPPPSRAPRLVVLLAIDQMSAERITEQLPGGLGRLAREGRVFTNAYLQHAGTETCPGHAALGTGRHPGPIGVPGNDRIDGATGQVVYCIEDTAADAAPLDPSSPSVAAAQGGAVGSPQGRSPRAIRATALGDWMKASDPRARVFSVSAKDRSAVGLGGQRPDGVYWLSLKSAVGFTTSRYYASALPAWVSEFNGPRASALLERAPERWEHRSDREGGHPDDFPGEATRYQRTSGHPVRDVDPLRALDQLYRSPFLDEVTLAFARTLIEQEKLGTGPQSDLLGLSLSANDTIGHLYGPHSQEALDALERLDASFGEFLEFLDERYGQGGVLLGLSADHGVLELPEWLDRQGRSECPVAGGRIPAKVVEGALTAHMDERFPRRSGRAVAEAPKPWFLSTGLELRIDPTLLAERGATLEAARAEAETFLERQPGIARVWTPDEIAQGTSEEARLYRNSQDPLSPVDLILEPAPTCLFSSSQEGTTHGSPHAYDRHVPLILFGNGITAGTTDRPAASVDVAPTLASRLGIPVPREVDGANLLADRP